MLIRWTPDSTPEQREAVPTGLLALRDTIPVVRDVRLGTDLGVRSDHFDFGVAVDFDSADDYLFYREHPDHVRLVADTIRPVMAERAGCVFEAAADRAPQG